LIQSVEQAINTVYLYPSALIADNSPTVVHTILGSCVAVCLFDPIRKTGGINHFMLPLWNGSGLPTPKFGNIAIERLIENMISLGTMKEHLIAKVFGGGSVIETTHPSFNIGEKNISIAFNMLKDHQIPIVSHSTGGKLGRKLIFNTGTGEVVQRYVKSDKAWLNG
jgi:chemotaxis protein CheD